MSIITENYIDYSIIAVFTGGCFCLLFVCFFFIHLMINQLIILMIDI